MKLLEYEAKQLLAAAGVPIPRGEVFARGEARPFSAPVVLKSQVPTGGRGKLGGVRIVQSETEIEDTINQLFDYPIKGFRPQKLLAEELLAIESEFYFSFTINRETSQIELLASAGGGVEVEEQAAADFFRRPVDARSLDALSDELADYLDIADKAFLLQDIVAGAYSCFINNDCLLLEINPLILTARGALVAGDAKITVDDAALFRHSDWQFQDKATDHNFVILGPSGTVATIANGAGLAMATVDTIAARGLTPANFLDIGGTATPDKILQCFQQIAQLPKVEVIVINIFGGIVRCDDVAAAIISARQQIANLPRLAVRLIGNREAQARELLAQHETPLYPDLETILEDIT